MFQRRCGVKDEILCSQKGSKRVGIMGAFRIQRHFYGCAVVASDVRLLAVFVLIVISPQFMGLNAF